MSAAERGYSAVPSATEARACREVRRAAGLCFCGRGEPVPGRRSCAACLERWRVRDVARQQRRLIERSEAP